MDKRARRVVAATVTGSGLVFIDLASVNVILPVLQRELEADFVGVQWVVEAYLLMLAALILAGGALGDRLGRRRVFFIGCMIMAAASVAAALAPNLAVLIGARLAQGAGSALIAPTALALIAEATPAGERSAAFGVWAAVTGLTTAGGPILAGFVADHLSWRVFFGLQPAVAVAAAWLVRRTGTDDPNGGHIDITGAALATLGLAGLTFGFLEWGRQGFAHPQAWGGIFGGLLVLAIFVWHEHRTTEPLLPLDVFRNKGFSGANVATLFIYAGLSGILFFVPFNLIQVQGWSATAAGAASLPLALVLGGLPFLTGRIADKTGPRWPMVIGAVLAAGGHALLARPGLDADYWTGFFPGLTLLGIGMASLVPAITATAESTVPAHHVGLAGGVNSAVARLAGLLAIAVMGVVAAAVFTAALPADVEQSVDTSRLAAAQADTAEGQRAIDEAFVAAYRVVAWTSAALALAGAAVVLFTAPAELKDDEDAESPT